jgi:pyridoxal phosphate enzyme (YggS family)
MSSIIQSNLHRIQTEIGNRVTLIAVTKYQELDDVKALYNLGFKTFAENRVQDLLSKKEVMPDDIQWHLIGTLQTNKVKYIAPFISLIQSVDSEKLLAEIEKQAIKNNRSISYLLQLHVAQEDTKHGMSISEAELFFTEKIYEKYPHCKLEGIMGMATNTDDMEQVKSEFELLKSFFDKQQHIPLKTLSMGMSGDYALAIECGSNMIRVGSALFK